MIIDHYAASIIAHYHTSNMAAVFSDCMLGEPQTPHLAILMYKILGNTKGENPFECMHSVWITNAQLESNPSWRNIVYRLHLRIMLAITSQ